jgi:hypothetical protein
LWVNDTLVKAIRTESAGALIFWFGVSANVVWKWRKAFGVSGTATTPGSKRVHYAACKTGAYGIKVKEWTDQELEAKAAAAKKCGTKPGPRWTPANGAWTADQVALLGTDDDKAIAKRIGRSENAVRLKRERLKITRWRNRVE